MAGKDQKDVKTNTLSSCRFEGFAKEVVETSETANRSVSVGDQTSSKTMEGLVPCFSFNKLIDR